MNIKGLQKTTLLDYPEKLACTVFTGGCNFRCPFCHNAALVRPGAESPLSDADILSFLTKRQGLLDGVVISGGENLYPVQIEDFLRGFDKIKEAVVKPLNGKKIAAYYGCLLLRPNKVMRMDDPENPKIIEDFIRAIGAEPVIYARRNACCGGYCTIKSKDYAAKQVDAIMSNARNCGAEMLITACPLCMYNLKKSQSELPVVYFTELLAEALGVKEG